MVKDVQNLRRLEETQCPPKSVCKSNPPFKSRRRGRKRTSWKWKPDDLYCFCRQPDRPGYRMIECDACGEWFHFDCVGMTFKRAKAMHENDEEWDCQACTKYLRLGRPRWQLRQDALKLREKESGQSVTRRRRRRRNSNMGPMERLKARMARLRRLRNKSQILVPPIRNLRPKRNGAVRPKTEKNEAVLTPASSATDEPQIILEYYYLS